MVLFLWGEKYPIGEMNHLIERVIERTKNPPDKIILLSDRPREGVYPGVEVKQIPEFFLHPEYLKSGCQTKLAMFENGMLDDRLPAIYLDLDTLVIGDISRCLDLLDKKERVAMIHSAGPPFGLWGRFVYWVTKGRSYARGNSSVMVFHPSENYYIAECFRELHSKHGPSGIKPMGQDERFISWIAQEHMCSVPTSMAVKFPTEFMLHHRWLTRLRTVMPGVKARRAGLIAVTMPGDYIKGQQLIKLQENDIVVDGKGRVLIWSESILGHVKKEIADYYTKLEEKLKGDK